MVFNRKLILIIYFLSLCLTISSFGQTDLSDSDDQDTDFNILDDLSDDFSDDFLDSDDFSDNSDNKESDYSDYDISDDVGNKRQTSSSLGGRIRPSYPSHYFYTPKAKVNPPWHLVTSLHEISFSFPANLQLFTCLLDNKGRINFGAKYGINDRFSVAAGLAATLFHMGKGSHGIPTHKGAKPRFGAYFCIGLLDIPLIENAVTIHTQMGDHFSLGADYGMQITPHEWWSAIFEVGNSIDFSAHKYSDKNAIWYFNFDTGVRVHPPPLPAFSFDLGIDIEEFPFNNDKDVGVTIFLDVIFAMVVM